MSRGLRQGPQSAALLGLAHRSVLKPCWARDLIVQWVWLQEAPPPQERGACERSGSRWAHREWAPRRRHEKVKEQLERRAAR